MRKDLCLFLFTLCFFIQHSYAQQGKNGAKMVSGVNTIANEYASLTSNASTGNTSLIVANSSLNTNNRFGAVLAQGDLIMIIQMQGASINGASGDSTWGAVTNYNNCGLYEFAEVAGVPNGNTINLNCPLKNNYTAAGKVQVVRVPRFSSLTIYNGGILTCDAWNGTQGGIVVTEVRDSTTINSGGTIDASGKGFRGGIYVNNTNGPLYTYIFSSTDIAQGGEQGESIAGFESDYTIYNGRYGRGAPANGGGGGNAWNCPGGGGANAGSISGWTGNGNPDITTNVSWISAWNLEYAGFANSTSSGGGRGGYNVGYTGPNPLIVGPNSSSWSNYLRTNTGGKGGRPLDYSTGRIFFGGGGGGPKADNNNGSSGANGGGIVYLLSYGTVAGSGTITANGNTALNANCGGNAGDPPGGGGGGGAVMISSSSTISGISIYANGGNGGNQVINNGGESEGPGGGGGGGYIAISSGNIPRLAAGGLNGTTNSSPMVNFPPDGGTKGGDGLAHEIISTVPFSFVVADAGTGVSICNGDTANLSASGGNTYLWSPSTDLSCTGCQNPVANPSHTTTYTVTVSAGICTASDSVTVTVLTATQPGTIASNSDSICSGSSVQLTVTGNTGSIQWQSSANDTSFTNLAGESQPIYNANNLTTDTYYRVEASGSCGTDSSPAILVNVLKYPVIGAILLEPNPVCAGKSCSFTVNSIAGSVQWQIASSQGIFTDIAGADSTSYITAPLFQTTDFRVVANNNTCADTSTPFIVVVNPTPAPPVLTTNDSVICASDSTLITTSGSYSSYLWNNGDIHSYTYATLAGGYWVTVTDANGCTVSSNHINIGVYPVPSVSIVVQGDTLSSFNAVAYQWYLNDVVIPNATLPVYIATQTGNYSIEITDTNGCKTRSNDVYIQVTGVADMSINSGIELYPNPTQGVVFIYVDNSALKQLNVFNAMGQKVISKAYQQSTDGRIEINIGALPAGIYQFQFIETDKYTTRLVMKTD